eukprot:TRINITY_DN8139_c2_g1_i1.p1 TRINITY_DN8139_c2_g1~~TRINITY_DN8139_c2_g1_i1.p1  ORF type:complete len:293 (+),score=61.32 TRINITY_DN8139_c2_g1_i1:340-1218(+)
MHLLVLQSLDEKPSSESKIHFMERASSLVNARDAQGRTPLHYASSDTYIRKLLELGADINSLDNEGQSPIFHSLYKKELMGNGASIDLQDIKGNTVFHLDHGQAFDRLIEMDDAVINEILSIPNASGRTVFHNIIEHGSIGQIDKLYEKCHQSSQIHVDLSPRPSDQQTPLMLYLSSHRSINTATFCFLAGKGFSRINDRDAQGRSAVHVAAQNQNLDALKNLKYRADFNVTDLKGRSAMHYLYMSFPDRGLNQASRIGPDHDGKTPLDFFHQLEWHAYYPHHERRIKGHIQ